MLKFTAPRILLILLSQNTSPGLSSCSDPPVIHNTESKIHASLPFPEGSAIKYSCLRGYKPYGKEILTCSNGYWSGSFNCTIRKCPSINPPEQGRMIFACHEVGCVIKFICDVGHQIVGSNTSQCQLNGNWSHAVPECRITKCSAPPLIEHGYFLKENSTDRQLHVYGTRLVVKCEEQFIRNGPARIYCDSRGKWTQAPECFPSTCPVYSGLDGKCVEGTIVVNLRDGGLLLFLYCTENSTLILLNYGPAVCHNGKWDVPSMRCYCDCKVNVSDEGIQITNFNPKTLLKHGQSLDWNCSDGYTQTFDAPLTCYDGTVEIPKCIPYHSSTNENVSEKSADKNQQPTKLIIGILGVFSILGTVIIVIWKFKHRCSDAESREGNVKELVLNSDVKHKQLWNGYLELSKQNRWKRSNVSQW